LVQAVGDVAKSIDMLLLLDGLNEVAQEKRNASTRQIVELCHASNHTAGFRPQNR
jgi:hypothetical protein